MEPGKLFVGGISWDTNEDRLKEYFETFGEVVEAVIMKDRNTGRARGFGFIIYADPAVAEKVVKLKHVLDGRTVEAKKAVPRDDQQVVLNKVGSNSVHGSPGPVRTKKIFVGGLPSTITESEFKGYFDQFGVITDVVVMYDHNTQRPRGFGFITFDSEEAVERVLVKTFHELSGKMVEVKRAVPKEFSPLPNRAQFGGNFGVNRVNGFMNGFNPGLFGVGAIGMQMGDRYSPVSVGRSGFPSFGPASYGSPMMSEVRMSPNGRETFNLVPNMGYERGVPAFYNGGNMAKRNDNNFGEYDGNDGASASSLGSTSWSLWGNGSSTNTPFPANSASSLNGFRSGDNSTGTFNRIEAIWGSSPINDHTGRTSSPNNLRGLSYGRTDSVLEPSLGNNVLFSGSSFSASNAGFEANDFQDLYDGNGGLSWLSSSREFQGPTSFELGLGNANPEVSHKNPGLCW